MTSKDDAVGERLCKKNEIDEIGDEQKEEMDEQKRAANAEEEELN